LNSRIAGVSAPAIRVLAALSCCYALEPTALGAAGQQLATTLKAIAGEARFDNARFVSALCGQVSLLSMGTPPPIQIATLGMWDTLILMVIALVVFGPRKLPQIGRQIGKLMYEFRKASNDFKFQMEEELRSAEEADRRKQEEERLRVLALTAPAQPAAVIEAATPSAASVMEGAYPEQTQYPSLAAVEDQTAASSEEPYPRIQPPSIGEQVPAAKPTGRAAQVRAADEGGDEVGELVSDDTSHDPVAEAALLPGADELRANDMGLDSSEDTQQAAHHG
jgi:sec-independent protein translocase protein TatB